MLKTTRIGAFVERRDTRVHTAFLHLIFVFSKKYFVFLLIMLLSVQIVTVFVLEFPLLLYVATFYFTV